MPLELLALLPGKDILLGVIDVASDTVETAEDVVRTIELASAVVPAERIFPCTNCGMAPMTWDVAWAKTTALGAGAALSHGRRS